MFARCNRHDDRSQLQLWLQLSCCSCCTAAHKLNMFISCDYPWLSHRLYKLKPVTWTSELIWHLESGRDWRDHKEYGRGGRRTLLCIGCTSVVQCERISVLQSTEMRNFSAAECGKAIRGNFICGTFHTCFSANYPLTKFLHSTFRKIPAPIIVRKSSRKNVECNLLSSMRIFTETNGSFLTWKLTLNNSTNPNAELLPY